MNVSQPVENPNIPAELVKQVTAVRNQISLGEGEVKRLADLVNAQKYEVNQIVKQKVDEESQIAILGLKKASLTEEIDVLNKKKDSLLVASGELEASLKKNTEKLTKKEEMLKALDEDMRVKKQNLEQAVDSLAREKKTFDADRKELDAKIDKLKKALS